MQDPYPLEGRKPRAKPGTAVGRRLIIYPGVYNRHVYYPRPLQGVATRLRAGATWAYTPRFDPSDPDPHDTPHDSAPALPRRMPA